MPPTSFNLKQRLAALSLSPSSPSSPNGSSYSHDAQDSHLRSPLSPDSGRRMFNTPNWMKKPQQFFKNSPYEGRNYSHGEEEKRMVQEVLGKMIFQAGVDFETRPMVVLNASALPDPQVVSYDLLLTRILSYLDLYVEADYTVVFFAAGSKHAPSWNWVWKAYRSLKRKYRKNLKQLYIVHSSFFSKMLFSLAGAIISPKFFRKLTYITTLSELAMHVPLTQIDIPPAVYQENLKFERKITMPVPTRSDLFGVPLEDIMGYDGEKGGIPRVVRDAIQFLRETGMQEEGLFRRSPSSSLLRAAQEAYDRGNVVSLDTFGDPHLAAVLLKKYLRDLPEPLFPETMYPIIRRCPLPSNARDEEGEMASIQYIREVILPELVPCAYILLSQILHLLHDVSLRSASNKMDATNLAIVICPNLVKGSNPMRDVMMCGVSVASGSSSNSSTASLANSSLANSPSLSHSDAGSATLGMVIMICIRRYYEVFDEVVDRSEAVAPWRALRNHGLASSNPDAGSSESLYVLGGEDDEDDEHDEEPTAGPSGSNAGAWPSSNGTRRHRNTLSNSSNRTSIPAARSVFGDSSTASPAAWNGTRNGTSSGAGTIRAHGKAKSLVSIDKDPNVFGHGTMRKNGSISIGRGTTRKGSGAAVEAVGVTAEGFFTPPAGAPPVPKVATPRAPPPPRNLKEADKPSSPAASSSNGGEGEGEERVLSVSERKKLFEGGS
ncbi:hypothetical protein D9613_009243 [Agrocybe pediades]|uniref:Uncharacterized protein n=1 Tax=Agrocybe pediades TaxID=84607 RepID=A0A8H4R586_9AGAR|nr:hypothetical protein D9613_009243 [Agrocybe pediades]